MTAPKISVVIPAYKAERTIRRAIDSVLAQEGCESTVIVVVDGDLDDTRNIVKQDYADAPVVLLVNDENRGVQFTRNRGLAEVADEYVMFLDADDFVEGRLLAGLAEALSEKRADLGFGPMQTLFESTGARGPTVIMRSERPAELFVDWMAEGRFVNPSAVMWRTCFLREIGGWDPAFHRAEDGEVAMRALLLGAAVARSDQGRGVYVIHDNPNRLTQTNRHLDALLAVPRKLLGIPSQTIEPAVVRSACARSLYAAAVTCHLRGSPDLGSEALAEARALGLTGHPGGPLHRTLTRLLGLRGRCAAERLARRLLRRLS
ncbi:MAG: glycosyltransferase family 2 protein [Allosphingosinicella sp.]|uniref:glycosyltransferase family 2 protein n=1 Tax=Allosphingosinicella sp. TaxID=2823234 RepID=UPI003954AC1F